MVNIIIYSNNKKYIRTGNREKSVTAKNHRSIFSLPRVKKVTFPSRKLSGPEGDIGSLPSLGPCGMVRRLTIPPGR